MSNQFDTIEKRVENTELTRTGDVLPAAVRPVGRVEARSAVRVSKAPGRLETRRRAFIDDDDDESFFQRNRTVLIVSAIMLVGAGWLAFHMPSGKSQAPYRTPEPMMVKITPLPPPPPPPKLPPPPPKDEKPPEQAPMAAPEAKPEEAKPKPVDKPPEGLGTNIKGPGEGLAGLSSGGGNGMLGGTGTGAGGGSMGAWYAGQVQAKIADQMRRHEKTRKASISGLKFSVSVDATGRITRVTLQGSTGNAELDKALENEVLSGLQMKEPPPGSKPMTIKMVLNARRQN